MAGGLAALLDDIAALAKMAAASTDDVAAATGHATAKAVGVVVDDAAVTPQYVDGIEPKRELPIIWKITLGSLRNKLLIILPVALVLSQFAPWALTPLLMLGGLYLSFEGAEKVWERIRHGKAAPASSQSNAGRGEKEIVSSAVRTDLILSSEIMVISLDEVAAETFWARAVTLVVVAIVMTLLVYGVVGLLVKMDDIGLHMARRGQGPGARFGKALVTAMPHVMSFISVVGVFAMLWVGGHILLTGLDDLGWHAPYTLVHHLEEGVEHVAGIGAVLAWFVETACAMVLGFLVGSVVLAVVHALPFGSSADHHDDAAAGHAEASEIAETGRPEPEERA